MAIVTTCVIMLVTTPARADRPGPLSEQTLKMTSGPASLKGLGESFSPNLSTGTGNFSIPIQLPPGIVKPSVTLTYTGGKGKSELGMSFRLPVLNIYRTTDKGSPDFNEDDRFAVEGPSLNDELVLVNPEKRWYRLRNEGAFALFVRDRENNSWTIQMPSGDRSYLGKSLEARATSGGRSYRWYISYYEDRFNHRIEYNYFKDSGRVYLEEIRYQLHAHPDYQNQVLFEYEWRRDVFTDYTYGDASKCALRMKSISVYHGSRRLRKYHLAYKNAHLSSQLSSVEMEGENGLKMPKLSFGYVEPSFNKRGNLVYMTSLPPLEGLVDGTATLEDVNADGLPDILYGTAGDYRYYENIDGERFSDVPVSLGTTGSPDSALYEEDTLLADIDGDGFRDVVQQHDGAFRYFPGGDIKDGVFRGFKAPKPLKTIGMATYHFGSSDVKMTDLNFDGRVDLIYHKPGQDVAVINTAENKLIEEYIAELPFDVNFYEPDVQLIDFNGDGILDFVRKRFNYEEGRVRVWLGLSHGYYAGEQEMKNVPWGINSEFYIQDVNRDGQADLVRISGSNIQYFLNDGNMRYTERMGDIPNLPDASGRRTILFADMNGNGTVDIVWLTLDWKLKFLELFREPNFGLLERVDNGMGMVTQISYRSSVAYLVDDKLLGRSWKTPMPNPVPVISEITTTDSLEVIGFEPTVTRTTFTYRDGYFDTKEREWRGFAEAASTRHGDEFHVSQVTETHMHVGVNLKTGEDEEILKGKPWLQLQKDINGDLISSVETQHEQRWLCQEDLVSVTEEILPRCSSITDDTEAKEDLVAFAVQTEALTGSWEKTNNPRYTASRSYFDEWGSRIRTDIYGEVVFAGARTPGDGFDLDDADIHVGDDEVVNESDFIYDIDKWLIGLSYQSRVRDISGQIVTKTQTYYDGNAYEGLPLGEVTKGLVTRSTAWLKESGKERYIDTQRMEYNSDGLVIGTLDANDNLVELEYDAATRSLPVTERFHAAVGPLEFTAEYDEGYGAIIGATDLNGHTSQFYYDGLGRLTDIVDPLGSLDLPMTHYEYEYGTPEYPISITTVQSLIDRDKGTYHTSWQYSDGLGRGRLTKSEAEEEHGYIGSGWTELSARGAAVKVYDSFSSTTHGFEAAPSFAPVTVTYFDALGRADEVYPPATPEYGATYTKTMYKPFETWVYDERDTYEGTWLYPAVTKVDGQGRVVEILKHNDVEDRFTELHWHVDYNTLGSITAFTDPKGNARRYNYDNLQRMVHVSDPNVGTIDYEYDDVGNLTKRVDALGQVQRFEYGLANRLISATMQNSVHGLKDYEYTYHYDEPEALFNSAQNLKGKLARVEWPTGTHHVSYDELDRLVKEVQTLWDGTSPYDEQKRQTYEQTYQYNAGGNLLSQTAPGGLSLDFQYNARSLLTQVSGGFEGDTRGIFTGIQYDHRGATVKTDGRNYISTYAWYDNRARLAGMVSGRTKGLPSYDKALNYKTDINNSVFQHLVYHRTPTGLLKSIDDLSPEVGGVTRLDASYKYDRLYQLTSADNTEDGKIDYAYDTIQNLVRRTTEKQLAYLVQGEFKYGERGKGPNQITSTPKHLFYYNAVGQMKSYNGFNLYFDVESRLVEADNPRGTNIKYYYDDTGEKKLAVMKKPDKPRKIYRYISGNYQIRDGKETWFISGGHGQAEITQSKGLEVDIYLLEEIAEYINSPMKTRRRKPVPLDYMDLDEDGDHDLDEKYLEIAAQAYWDEKPVGKEGKIWRYYYKDHLGGNTIVTDAIGEVVSSLHYHPYGQTASRSGQKPVYGFAGGEIEEEEALGLVRFGARWYAPAIGRWVSADPLFVKSPTHNVKSSLESGLYSYALNNPVSFTDPLGMETPVGPDVSHENQTSDMFDPDPPVESSNGELSHSVSSGCDAPATIGSSQTPLGRAVEHFSRGEERRQERIAAKKEELYSACSSGSASDCASAMLPSGQDMIDAVDDVPSTGIVTGPSKAVNALKSGKKGGNALKKVTNAGKKFIRDFSTKNTKNLSAKYASQRDARNLARTKLGKNPVEVEPGKLRSQDGRWQYRGKTEDLTGHGSSDSPHIHLERLEPETGEVLENWHLRW